MRNSPGPPGRGTADPQRPAGRSGAPPRRTDRRPAAARRRALPEMRSLADRRVRQFVRSASTILISSVDDDIVVVVTTEQYLYSTEETNRKRELAFGKVCEPPAPFFSHQELVLRVARLLCSHVEPRDLGKVAVAPVDVILDRER